MASLKALFDDEVISRDYAQKRTFYCEELFQTIADFCQESRKDLDLVVDIGCGAGNSTVGFTRHFKKVIGVDLAQAMIDQAPRDYPNCEFKVGLAEDLNFLQDESVDLFSAGLAFFLMPQKAVLLEANRVLKPGGTLAIFGYGAGICSDATMGEIIKQTMKRAYKHLPNELNLFLNHYEKVDIPFSGWEKCLKKGPPLTDAWDLETIWAGIWRLMQRALVQAGPPEEADMRYTQEVKQLLSEKMPNLDPQKKFDMKWETTILLARKPS